QDKIELGENAQKVTVLGELVYPELVQQAYRRFADVSEVSDRVEHDQVPRVTADRKQHVVLLLCRYGPETWIQNDGSMVRQSRCKAGTGTGWIEFGRQQIGRIHLANEILELEVRTSEESLAVDISERKDEHARRAALGLHGYLTLPYKYRGPTRF